MSLFGGLFGGGSGGGQAPVYIADVTYEIEQEFIDLAIELLDETIPQPNAIWQARNDATVVNPDEPWKTQPGQVFEYPVRILFFQDPLEDQQLLKYLKGTETNEGRVNAIMYRTDFEPSLQDTLIWNNRTLVTRAVNPIVPIKDVIVYLFEFAV